VFARILRATYHPNSNRVWDGERLMPDAINGSTFLLHVSLVSPVEATYVQRKSEDAFAALAHGNNERSPSTLRLHAKLAFSLSHSS